MNTTVYELGCLVVAGLLLSSLSLAAEPPTDNPAARYGLEWTDAAKWDQVVSIETVEGKDWNEKIEKAQDALEAKGGGVIYFPAGEYEIADTIRLRSNIILRGATPEKVTDARKDDYLPPTTFLFPAYKPTFEGEGTPKDTAFKGIELRDMNKDTHCGVVNIDLSHGHIHFGVSVYDKNTFVENFATYGRNHIVYGCRLRHAAVADPTIPREFQHPWQRWTFRHRAAIDIRAAANMLVANNRIAKSGENNFVMKGYKVYRGTGRGATVEVEAEFKYDNRPGIYMNYGNVRGTPEEKPWNFVKGIYIRENYVYSTGCLAIGFSGDGTYCGHNVVRYEKGVALPFYNGYNQSKHVNNVRAVEMRGWRWTVEYNDYVVHKNLGGYNDGEGLMHESHGNVSIRDSKLLHNKGNAYLCLWRTPVDGLLIKGNDIDTRNGHGAICVKGKVHRSPKLHPVKNVQIIDNITRQPGTAIAILGTDGENNVISGNRHDGEDGKIYVHPEAKVDVRDNTNYTVEIAGSKKK